MLNRAKVNWTVKGMTNRIGKGEITTDNAIQRKFVWDVVKQSLLIHSVLTGYPIPPFFTTKLDGKYDLLDGKQRATTFCRFLNGDFELKGLPPIPYEFTEIDENGEEVKITDDLDINGMTLQDLPEDLQDIIKDYNVDVIYFDNITEDEISEMFFRLNNGKPLSAIEITRAKAKSFDTIKAIGEHEIFNSALTDNALNKYVNEDIVIKAWTILNVSSPSFETKAIRKLMLDTDITVEQREEIEKCFNRILETYTHIKENFFDAKIGAKIAKKILVKTHLLSLVPFALMSIEDNKDVKEFSDWVCSFYGTKNNSKSISMAYNNAETAKPAGVKTRNEELMKSYTEFFDAKEYDENEAV